MLELEFVRLSGLYIYIYRSLVRRASGSLSLYLIMKLGASPREIISYGLAAFFAILKSRK